MYDDTYVFVGTESASHASNGLWAPLLVHKAVVEHADGAAVLSAALYDGLDDVGTQTVDVGGTKTGASATGLANSAEAYGLLVSLDGAANQQVTVTGSAAQTYTNLVTQINADLTGASCAIVSGNLKFFSSTRGVTSAIALTNSAGTASNILLSALTDFASIKPAVAGTAVKIGLTTHFAVGTTFERYKEADFDPAIRFQNGMSTVIVGTGVLRIYYSH